jgi:hypothetical protein
VLKLCQGTMVYTYTPLKHLHMICKVSVKTLFIQWVSCYTYPHTTLINLKADIEIGLHIWYSSHPYKAIANKKLVLL